MKIMTRSEIKSIFPEVQKVQLSLLEKLDEVCRKNGIVYYLAYGSCIGAVRHKGFIPWDHDIDVLMSVDDVDRLIRCQGDFGRKYKLYSWKTSKEWNSISCVLVDRETTCIVKTSSDADIYHGVSIDIYPFYFAPLSNAGLKYNILLSHIFKICVANRAPENHGILPKMFGSIFLFFIRGKRRKTAYKIENKLRGGKGKDILDYFGLDIGFLSAITYPYEWFGEPLLLEFEGKEYYVPRDYDSYLEKRYGDYMEMPPVTDREEPYDLFLYIDTKKGYKGKWKE